MGNKKKTAKYYLLLLTKYYVDVINDWLNSIIQYLKDLGERDNGE